MKEHKRMIERAARKIERERVKIEGQEQKQLKEIQKLAKAGQHVSHSLTEGHLLTEQADQLIHFETDE
jgi:vacuolar-type H+-ATPase subunit H